MGELASRAEAIRARIARACEAAGRDPASVELLPVSKRQPLELIAEAAELGFRSFGENYVQEGAAKAEARPDLGFCLLGPLQRNKAKAALQHFREIQSVDRPELVERLRQVNAELRRPCGIWIQVDLWGEATKVGGCPEDQLPALRAALQEDPLLPLAGLMALPPPGDSGAFSRMAGLRERLQQDWGRPLRLSMGMSGDLEAAVAAGSDQVRIGTAFFGERSS